MKKRPELVILALWCIAIVATLLVVKEKREFTILAPVYAICMIGSVLTVRNRDRK